MHDAVEAFVARDVGKAESVLGRCDHVRSLEQVSRVELEALVSGGSDPALRYIAAWAVCESVRRVHDHVAGMAGRVVAMDHL
jgi:phosphate uptake regulator